MHLGRIFSILYTNNAIYSLSLLRGHVSTRGSLFVDYPKPREVMSIFPSGTDNKPGNEVVSGESSKCD